MTLVFGGAYQGKGDWAREHLGIGDDDLFHCTPDKPELRFDRAGIRDLHLFVLAAIRVGFDPVAYIEEHIDRFAGLVVICDDISGGIVPMDAEMRAWREAVGRCMGMLSRRADRVVRVFCGLGLELKG